eukprot:TRINITY_DN11174_c0_g1_i1.p2 TRINITY_DN11174_c0_g1~~TRINITY_DN11174_c0_g1_i1.p2  ORF type:complete len:88 (-),score=12.41 TRINITY_DN11174_c0_g1_i1:560-823(-)
MGPTSDAVTNLRKRIDTVGQQKVHSIPYFIGRITNNLLEWMKQKPPIVTIEELSAKILSVDESVDEQYITRYLIVTGKVILYNEENS